MKRERVRLTPYLAAALRLGGPRCEHDFLGLEHRRLLKGAPPAGVVSLHGRLEHHPEPEPAPAGPVTSRSTRRGAAAPEDAEPKILYLTRRAA